MRRPHYSGSGRHRPHYSGSGLRFLLAVGGLAALACAPPAKREPAAAKPPPAAAAPGQPTGFEQQPGENVTAQDLTQDGKPDAWTYSLRDASGSEVLLRKEKDLNGDGKVDTWEKLEPGVASPARVAYDLDFDGKPDVTLFFEKEQLVRKELAPGFDGVPRTWNFYEKGKLVRKERDTNGDGKVDAWEYWEAGELERIGVDLDGDGRIDRWDARKRADAATPGAPQK